jgi:hypothetical protein
VSQQRRSGNHTQPVPPVLTSDTRLLRSDAIPASRPAALACGVAYGVTESAFCNLVFTAAYAMCMGLPSPGRG